MERKNIIFSLLIIFVLGIFFVPQTRQPIINFFNKEGEYLNFKSQATLSEETRTRTEKEGRTYELSSDNKTFTLISIETNETKIEINSTEKMLFVEEQKRIKWDYQNAGHDNITSKENLIIKGNYVCVENDYITKREGGLGEQKVYTNCIEYPEQIKYRLIPNETNKRELINVSYDAKNITRINNKFFRVDYEDNYDPLILNYTEGLQACYSFDNDAGLGESSSLVYDQSGNGHNLTVSGATVNSSGLLGGAFTYDGVNDYMEAPTDELKITQNITISLWFKVNGTGTGEDLLLSWDDGSSPAYEITLDQAGTEGYICNFDLTGNNGNLRQNVGNVDEGVWHHLVCTYNSSVSQLYRNTANIATDTATDGNLDYATFNAQALRIGNGGSASAFLGEIDEVAIWDRALNSTEINELYNSGSGVNCTDILASGSGGGADTTAPTYSNIANNQTVNATLTNFSVTWNDETSLTSGGGYIFTTNNTGTFTNDTFVSFSSTPSPANVEKILNATVGNIIAYGWYANDSSDNWNFTGLQLLTVTAPTPTDSCTYTSGDWIIDCSDNCNLISTDLGGNSFTISGTGTVTGVKNLYNYLSGTVIGGCSTYA